jgi:hypothetical protein
MLVFIPRRQTTLSTSIFLLDPLSKSEFLSFTSAAEEDCHTRGLVRGIIVGAIFFALNKLGKVKADG